MEHLDLILTVTGGLFAALVLGFGMHRLGLSPIVGYLLAGVVVGPSTPGYVANEAIASELAEIGVILLMFGVGLQFHLSELLALRKLVIPGALVGIATAIFGGAFVSGTWGLSGISGIAFGLTVAVTSTVVLVRVLADQGQLHTPVGRTAMGWLVVEDIFTVLALVALPLVVNRDAAQANSLWTSLALAALKLGGFVAIMLIAGQRAIPQLFEYVAKTRSRELFTLTVLVSALGIAVGSAKLFGASMALGAFLAGTIVGQSEFSARAAADALPMRDAFAVLFFVSVGMLFEPQQLIAAPERVLLVLLVVMVAKPLAAFAITRLLGKPTRLALPLAASLAQIGEFSFVLASLGQGLDVLPAQTTSTVVAVAIISITLNPLLYRAAHKLAVKYEPAPAQVPAPVRSAARDLAVIVGHGPTGQIVREILSENGMDTAVIDLNLDTVRALEQRGVHAVYGDATHAEILSTAGIGDARALFLTSSTLENTAEVVRRARELKADLKVYTRTMYLREVAPLRRAGADNVVSAEAEVALAMVTALLDDLGASPDQIERERDRVHTEFEQQVDGHDAAHG